MSGSVVAVVQARVSSSRLPGKVLKTILGEPMIVRQLERIRHCRLVSRIAVATSTDASDDPLAAVCANAGFPVHRGSLADVLDRFYRCAASFAPDHVVRMTGDCPVIDPAVADGVIRYHLDGGYDFTSNALQPTFPDGLDVEVVRFAALERTWREAHLPSEREHVMPYIYAHPELFRIGHFKSETDRSHLRWTVDEPEDFELIRQLYEELLPGKPAFSMEDILAVLETNPRLAAVNRGFKRNEGLEKSRAQDRKDG